MDTEVASHLQSEIQKIWERLVALENRKPEHKELKATADDLRALLEKEPAAVVKTFDNASRQCSKYFNRIKEKYDTLNQMWSDWEQHRISLQQEEVCSKELLKNLEAKLQDVEQKETFVANEYSRFSTEVDSWNEKIELLEQDSERCQNNFRRSEEISADLQSKVKESEVFLNRITMLHKKAVEERDKVEEVSDEILGYDYEDETSGETRHEEGLKEKLQDAFKDLEKKHEAIRGELDDLKKRQEEAYDAFLSSRQAEVEALKLRIESLLPNALTAGLSSAYAEKRKHEEEERRSATTWFIWAAVAMALAALCPIGAMVGRWWVSDLSFLDVLMRSPRIVLAFLPLYIPLFWITVVFNKRMNLAKRLIEEYSHKEALSKTFEGLVTQIEAINGGKGASELRVRLLYNLIDASAENPGKLISGYNCADNPVVEILDKGAALGKSLEKLASVPEISMVLQAVNKRNERKKEEVQASEREGVAAVEEHEAKTSKD